jgi:hypothetical protein
MTDQIGFHSYDGTGLSEEILASKENLIEQSITIVAGTVDSTNSVTTDLRRGLVLWPDPGDGGKYSEFDAGAKSAAAGAEAVVLAVPIDMSAGVDIVAKAYYGGVFKPSKLLDDSGVDIVAKAYLGGVFKPSKLLDDSGFTLTHFDATERAKAQRIIIKNE